MAGILSAVSVCKCSESGVYFRGRDVLASRLSLTLQDSVQFDVFFSLSYPHFLAAANSTSTRLAAKGTKKDSTRPLGKSLMISQDSSYFSRLVLRGC